MPIMCCCALWFLASHSHISTMLPKHQCAILFHYHRQISLDSWSEDVRVLCWNVKSCVQSPEQPKTFHVTENMWWWCCCYLKRPVMQLKDFWNNIMHRAFGQEKKTILTKPYPLDFPVCLSVITTASSISPNTSKYFLRLESVVWYGKPPTNILV